MAKDLARVLNSFPCGKQIQFFPFESVESDKIERSTISHCCSYISEEHWYALLYSNDLVRLDKKGEVRPNGDQILDAFNNYENEFGFSVKITTFKKRTEFEVLIEGSSTTFPNANISSRQLNFYKLDFNRKVAEMKKQVKEKVVLRTKVRKNFITPSPKNKRLKKSVQKTFTYKVDSQVREFTGSTIPNSPSSTKSYRNVVYAINGREYKFPHNYVPVLEKDFNKMVADLRASKEQIKKLSKQNSTLRSELRIANEMIDEYQNELEENENAIQIGKKIERINNITQVPSTPEGRRLYNSAFAIMPKVSADSLSMGIPLISAALLSDLKVLDHLEEPTKLIDACPSTSTLKSNLDEAREQVYLEIAKDVVNGIPFSLLTDKKKAGIERLVVQVAKFCENDEKVKLTTLAADGSLASDDDVANAIDYILQWIDMYIQELTDEELTMKIFAQSTDAGGGGVGESVMKELERIYNRVADGSYTLTCAMHAIARAFQVAFETSLGTSGLQMKTILQWLHTVWSIQEQFGEHFDDAWKEFTTHEGENEEDNIMERLCKPLLTRWMYVLRCAENILTKWDRWTLFLNAVYETFDTIVGKMARRCIAQLKSPILKCQLEFIVSFGNAFFKKFYAWLTRIDEHTKTSGFCSHEMLPCIANMEISFKQLKDGWRENPNYASCITILNALPSDVKDDHGNVIVFGKETTSSQFELFFKEFEAVFEKNFSIWKRNGINFTIASSNAKVATTFAKWYCDHDLSWERSDQTAIFDNCNVHSGQMTVQQWISFLDTCTKTKDYRLEQHVPTVQAIADGSYLYEEDASEEISNLRRDVKKFYFIVAHCSQMTERAVQEADLCRSSNKGEHHTSALVGLRSTEVLPVYEILRKQFDNRIKQGNQHMSKGVNKTDRVLRSAYAQKKQNQVPRVRHRPTKFRAKMHLQQAMDSVIDNEGAKSIRRVRKLRKPILKMKGKRADAFSARIARGQASSRKRAAHVNVDVLTPPAIFQGSLKVTNFSKSALLPYALRELEARNENTQGITSISKAKTSLAIALLIERTTDDENEHRPRYTREYLLTQEWQALKSLLEANGGLDFSLKHPDNVREANIIHDIMKGRGNVV